MRLAHNTCKVPFIVIAGARTIAEEAKAVANGVSQTLHSRHLPNKSGFACAVDVVAISEGKADWSAKQYPAIAAAMFNAAHTLGHVVEWGGNWKTLKDYGHFQLPWAQYP